MWNIRAHVFWVFCAAFCSVTGVASADPIAIRKLVRDLVVCNPKLISSSLNVKVSEVDLQQTKLDRLPTFSVNSDGFVASRGGGDVRSSLQASMPLVTFGRQRSSELVAEAESNLARSEYNKSVADHTKQLLDLWVENESLLKKIGIINETLAIKKEFVSRVEQRAGQGVSSGADLVDVKARYAADVSDLQDLELRLIGLKTDLAVMSCESIADQRVIWTDLPVQPSEIHAHKNPAYQVALANLEVSQKEVELLQLSNVPTLELEASVDPGDDFNGRLGVSFSYEYENLGRSQGGSVQKGQFRSEEAKSDLIAMQIEIEQKLTQDFAKVSHIREVTLPAVNDEILNYEAKLASTERLFDAGRKAALEVMTDAESVKQARLDKISAEQELFTTFNSIAYATGVYVD